MRLYLSSFRMGDHPEHRTALAGPAGRAAVVIANAMDGAPDEVRRYRTLHDGQALVVNGPDMKIV